MSAPNEHHDGYVGIVEGGPVHLSADRYIENDPAGWPPSDYVRFRIRLLFLNVIMVFLVAFVCDEPIANHRFIFDLMLVFFGIWYIWHTRELRAYLDSILSTRDMFALVDRLRLEPGRLVLKCECSHVVSGKDAKGEVFEKVVTTFLNRTCVPIDLWTDVSGPLPEWTATASGICKIKSVAKFEFANPESARFVDRFAMLVYHTHRHRDVLCIVTCELELPGLLPRTLMLPHQTEAAPWWLYPHVDFAAACLLLSWPYHTLFEAKSTRLRVCFRKRYEFNAGTPCVVNMVDEQHEVRHG
jgi:hypothetical protein